MKYYIISYSEEVGEYWCKREDGQHFRISLDTDELDKFNGIDIENMTSYEISECLIGQFLEIKTLKPSAYYGSDIKPIGSKM